MNDLFCTPGNSDGCLSLLMISQVLVCAFLSVLFLQSGIDKVADRKGNLEWLTGHFANSPFKNVVGLLLTQITIQEIAAGILCAVGAGVLAFTGAKLVAIFGLILASASVLCLFIGQRLAKDYEGAAVLVNYFVLTILGLYLFAI